MATDGTGAKRKGFGVGIGVGVVSGTKVGTGVGVLFGLLSGHTQFNPAVALQGP